MKITNEEAKQQAIQKAYGEYWDKVKDHVTEFGGLSYQDCATIFGHGEFYKPDGLSDIWKWDDGYYTPKEIYTIEYNNGWLRIERPNGNNLPPDKTTCHFLNMNDPEDYGEALWEYLENDKQYHLDNHTHFRLPRERFERPQY